MAAATPSAASERFARIALLPMRSIGSIGAGGATSLLGPFRELIDHREMLSLLVKRDLKARYKDSALGFLWVLARPLMQLAIYFVVLGHFLGAARGIPDFAIYVFAGLTAMGLFQEILVGGTGSILANAGLVKKVYVPREVFPLASTGAALFNFGIQLLVLVIATFAIGKPPLHIGLIYFLPALALIVVYGLALALLCGAVNVYLRDTQYLVEVLTMLLFWASPVVYAWQMVSQLVQNFWLIEAYTNNPLTLAVLGFQRAFWVAGDEVAWPDHLMLRTLIALVIGVVLLFVSHRVFLRLQGNFAQEL
ncbi:sugar ABC transporter [Microbacterium sp. CH12i]|uniref:ABC transporter permease n=1 Tax=Microbacterium sp. CH12i TaxID=1479651 RepID=UPI000461E3FC|nr:ABC transporter permease [Microbacterium sp. CH12i]KDA06607.1 sugar ABC transporter [Microbacterium sp. CH12i]